MGRWQGVRPSGGSTSISPQECVGKEENLAKPFTGYIRTDGRRERREKREDQGGLVCSMLVDAHIKAGVTYAEAIKRREHQ
jgi:hypothetical protein